MSIDLTLPSAMRRSSESTHGKTHGGGVLIWRIAAVVSIGTSILLNAAVSWRSASAPRTPWDENGVLPMARIIAGDQDVVPMSGSGYYPGWSFLLAPIWWITQDPTLVYDAANKLAIAVAIATIIPLTLLAKRFGLSTSRAATAAGLVMCLPSRTVLSDYVLSEQLTTFFIVWTVLAAFAVWTRPSWWRMALLVLAVTAAYLTHARAISVVLTAAVWLVCYLRRRWTLAVFGLALLGLGYLAVQYVAEQITSQILLSGFTKGENMALALSTTTPELFSKVALSQSWAQLVGTFGLAAVGGVVLTVWTWRELRGLRIGPAGFLFGLISSTVAVSIMWWSGSRFLEAERPRFDVWVYTRYIDPVMLIIVLLALVALIRGLNRVTILVAAASSILLMIPVLLWVAPSAPTWGAYRGPANAAGVLQWNDLWPGEPFETPLIPSLTNPNRFWLIASLCVLACLAVFFVLRRWPVAIAVFSLVVFSVSSLYANPNQYRDPPDKIMTGYEQLAAHGYDGPVVFDLGCQDTDVNRGLALNWLGFWASPWKVELADSEDEPVHAEVLVSCDEWDSAPALGARAIKNAINYGYRVWVLPGDLQDAMTEDGLLGSVQQPQAPVP